MIFKAKNFHYENPQQYDYQSSRVFKSMKSINKKFYRTMKSGYTTTLIVHIPKHSDHPFWNIDLQDPEIFKYVPSKNSISFQVQRWGPSLEYANYYATQRAKDIILNIHRGIYWREKLLHGVPSEHVVEEAATAFDFFEGRIDTKSGIDTDTGDTAGAVGDMSGLLEYTPIQDPGEG
jgi:hypothetical protein